MAALDRSELNASSLADLHAIADQVGLDGFRRLRKAELVDAILRRSGSSESEAGQDQNATDASATDTPARAARANRARTQRGGRVGAGQAGGERGASEPEGANAATETSEGESADQRPASARRRRSLRSRTRSSSDGPSERRTQASRTTGNGRDAPVEQPEEGTAEEPRTAEGVVELLGNGSAFLRVEPPEPSDDDVYVSAAQVRRCELVSGDRVSGPVRTPRRSERYPSLVRIDSINGAPADTVSEGTRYENLEVAYPSERLALDSEDPTLKAIEWLTPIGRGSRVLITGAARAGKTETLRKLLGALAARGDLEVTLVLSGVRPEELLEWQHGPVPPASSLTFSAGADSQGQAVERALESAKRVAARGGDALVLIDSLDGVHPQVARRALAAARKLTAGGSLTIIATATRPFGGETTVVALDATLTSTGRFPALDLLQSGTVRPELLVGEDGARAITQARTAAASAVVGSGS